MKVILKSDVKKLGKSGEIVEVAEGYGRNFLIPKKLAEPATAENVNIAKDKAKNTARKKAQEADEAKLLAAQLEKIQANVPVRVGEGGKIFGSVTGKDVADSLKKEHGIEIDRRKISLQSEITGPGEYDAVIKLHPEAIARIKVIVSAEQ